MKSSLAFEKASPEWKLKRKAFNPVLYKQKLAGMMNIARK